MGAVPEWLSYLDCWLALRSLGCCGRELLSLVPDASGDERLLPGVAWGPFCLIAWLSLKRKMCFDLAIHTKYIITLTPELFVKASFGVVQHQDYQYQLWRHFQLKLFCSFSWWHFQMNLTGQKSIKIRAHIAYLNETNLWCFWLNMETDPIFRLVADCF